MLSKIVVLSCFAAVVLSATTSLRDLPIVSQRAYIAPGGSFQWSYENADGTKQEQSGSADGIQGVASWSDPEGGQHELRYVADASGYHPQSADVPVAPEIPAHVIKALKWIAAHPPPNLTAPLRASNIVITPSSKPFY